jgi:hypothetical protein
MLVMPNEKEELVVERRTLLAFILPLVETHEIKGLIRLEQVEFEYVPASDEEDQMVGNIMMMYKFEGSDNDEGFTVNW